MDNYNFNQINLKEVFNKVWYISYPYPEIINNVTVGIPEKEIKGDYQFNKWDKKDMSDLGVSFYTKNDSNIDVFMPIWVSENSRDAKEYLLPNTIMSLTNKKNIVITPLVNRKGTVKEEVSFDDWELNIKGVVVGKGNNYPDAEVQKLLNWYNDRTTFNIQNARTSMCLGKEEKVIMVDIKLPELSGYQNTQPFEMKLISDSEFSLYIE